MNSSDYTIKGAVVYGVMLDLINIHLTNKKKIIDIGCGNMRLLENITAEEKFGIDTDKNHLKESRKKYKGATYIHANVLDLPFPSRTFDGALSINVFHHVALLDCLPEIYRVLSPNADFISVVMNKDFPITVDHLYLVNKFKKKGKMFSWQASDYEPVVYSKKELEKTFQQHGFQVIQIIPFDSYMMNIFDLGSTVILRIVPERTRDIFFRIFHRIARIIFIIESKFLHIQKTRSYYVYVRKGKKIQEAKSDNQRLL